MTTKPGDAEVPVRKNSPRNLLFQATRRVLLAGVGAVILAQEEADNFVRQLVERGEMAEKDARKLLRELGDERRKQMHEEKPPMPAGAASRAATKADIEMLNAKIAELTKVIDQLQQKP